MNVYSFKKKCVPCIFFSSASLRCQNRNRNTCLTIQLFFFFFLFHQASRPVCSHDNQTRFLSESRQIRPRAETVKRLDLIKYDHWGVFRLGNAAQTRWHEGIFVPVLAEITIHRCFFLDVGIIQDVKASLCLKNSKVVLGRAYYCDFQTFSPQMRNVKM